MATGYAYQASDWMGRNNAVSPATRAVNQQQFSARDVQNLNRMGYSPGDYGRLPGAGGSTSTGEFNQQVQDFRDDSYGHYTRRLDPMWERNQNRFSQDLVNRGMAVGSEGYNRALEQFEQSRSDSYLDAGRMADQQAYALQGQWDQQNLAREQLANALSIADRNNAASQASAMAAQGASMYGSDTRLAGLLAQLGENARQFDMGHGLNYDQLGLNALLGMGNLGLGQYGAETNRLGTLGNLDLGYGQLGLNSAQFNSGQNAQQFDMINALLGGVQGQSAPPINVGGAFNTAQNSAWNNYQANRQNDYDQNAQMAQLALGLLGYFGG